MFPVSAWDAHSAAVAPLASSRADWAPISRAYASLTGVRARLRDRTPVATDADRDAQVRLLEAGTRAVTEALTALTALEKRAKEGRTLRHPLRGGAGRHNLTRACDSRVRRLSAARFRQQLAVSYLRRPFSFATNAPSGCVCRLVPPMPRPTTGIPRMRRESPASVARATVRKSPDSWTSFAIFASSSTFCVVALKRGRSSTV